MAAIQKALGNLYYSIENLEGAVKKCEQKTVQSQQDLFGRVVPGRQKFSGIDSTALAKKLDGTIAKIEQLLSEG